MDSFGRVLLRFRVEGKEKDAHPPAMKEACLSNLRRCYLSLLKFSRDHDFMSSHDEERQTRTISGQGSARSISVSSASESVIDVELMKEFPRPSS